MVSGRVPLRVLAIRVDNSRWTLGLESFPCLAGLQVLEVDFVGNLDDHDLLQWGKTLQSFPQLTALRLGYGCYHVHEPCACPMYRKTVPWSFARLQHLKLVARPWSYGCTLPNIKAPELKTLSILHTLDPLRARQLCLQAPSLVSVHVILDHAALECAEDQLDAFKCTLGMWRNVAEGMWPDLDHFSWTHRPSLESAENLDHHVLEQAIADQRVRVIGKRNLNPFDRSLDPLTRLDY